ncbi:MAG: J domain-containing protein, partial [Pyrinomonadaceae bacterium]
MSEYNAYPLSWPLGWPRHAVRIRSRFGKWNAPPSVAQGAKKVLAELKRMGVDDHAVVISTNIELRLDGLPRSDRRAPTDPGAAVYFRLWNDQRKVLACDKYVTVGDNLYAIGLTIEATRGIERWGSVTVEQAFAGYVALEEKTTKSCWEVLGIPAPDAPGLNQQNRENAVLDAYRRKARET